MPEQAAQYATGTNITSLVLIVLIIIIASGIKKWWRRGEVTYAVGGVAICALLTVVLLGVLGVDTSPAQQLIPETNQPGRSDNMFLRMTPQTQQRERGTEPKHGEGPRPAP